MKYFNSYFKYTRSQQRGVLLLLFLIICLQCIYFFMNVPSREDFFDSTELESYQKEVDSLRVLALEKKKPRIYPFNPNYITDYKGYTLGMSLDAIDRLHTYRGQNKWVNSARQFQQVTKVSDSLLGTMSAYFKFPDWVTNPKPKTFFSSYNTYNKALSFDQKVDLNKATAKQLQKVNGIGEKLSERIVIFRNKFSGGFIADVQLQDVYGLTPEVIEKVTHQFTVKTPKSIHIVNVNVATVEELVMIQHVDYDLAYEIVDQRTLRDGFSSFDELTKVKGFPSNKIEIIKLYLTLD